MPSEQRLYGYCHKFLPERGFGFASEVQDEAGNPVMDEELFLHANQFVDQVWHDRSNTPQLVGRWLTFTIGERIPGKRAAQCIEVMPQESPAEALSAEIETELERTN
jgi:hypothetical protein